MAKLCLHFDVNKTVIVADAGSGRDFEASLNSLLSEAVWGCFPRDLPIADRTAEHWTPLSGDPGAVPPSDDSVSFGAYLEENTALSKAERRAIKCRFTDTPTGQPYRRHLKALLTHLDFTSPLFNFSPEAVEAARRLPFLAAGRFQLLPAFFQLLAHLVEQRVDFRIVFRTFGVDLPSVAEELNLYCECRHPLFRPPHALDGTDPTDPRDLRLRLPGHSAMLRRSGPGADGLHLAYVDNQQLATIASGAVAVRRVLEDEWLRFDSPARAKICVGLRDDYAWWDAHGESDDAGKLLLVDAALVRTTAAAIANAAAKAATAQIKTGNIADFAHTSADGDGDGDAALVPLRSEQVVTVFFDDNIERHRAHIVDVRCQASLMPVPFSEAQGAALFKVEPFLAITQRDYFSRLVDSIRARYRLLP